MALGIGGNGNLEGGHFADAAHQVGGIAIALRMRNETAADPVGLRATLHTFKLEMLLRPGNAGSNTFADHKEVLAAAIRQVPARFRRKILLVAIVTDRCCR